MPPTPSTTPTDPPGAAPGRAWRIVSIGLLGFASGLPLRLSGSTLQAWFTDAGLSLQDIGWVTMVGVAYTLKFVWAPLLDRVTLPFLGRRRGWIVVMQLVCAGALFGMSWHTPQGAAGLLALFGVILAFASATQDIAYDAHRTDLLRAEERGWGTAFQQGGYRIAMLVSGGIALILADHLNWAIVYRLMGLLMLAVMLVTLRSPDAPDEYPARTFAAAVIEPFTDFFGRFGALAVAWLALMVLYKVTDAFVLSLSTSFMMRAGEFSLTDLGVFKKTLGLVASIVGAMAGGWLVTRMRLFRALVVLGVCQAMVNLSYIWLLHAKGNLGALGVVVTGEHLFSGMGDTAFVVLVTCLCNVRFSAAQYALLSSLAAVGRVFLGPLAGWLVPQIGWADFFVVTTLSAIPGLLLLVYLRRAIHEVEWRPTESQQPTGE